MLIRKLLVIVSVCASLAACGGGGGGGSDSRVVGESAIVDLPTADVVAVDLSNIARAKPDVTMGALEAL